MTARWKAERDKLKGAADIKDRLDQARGELEQAGATRTPSANDGYWAP